MEAEKKPFIDKIDTSQRVLYDVRAAELEAHAKVVAIETKMTTPSNQQGSQTSRRNQARRDYAAMVSSRQSVGQGLQDELGKSKDEQQK
eukprot:179736-Ditylum_brightwellii.AAC.1